MKKRSLIANHDRCNTNLKWTHRWLAFFKILLPVGIFPPPVPFLPPFFLFFFYRRVLFLDVSWLASFSSLPLRKGGMCRVSRGKSSLPCKFGAFLSRVSTVHFLFFHSSFFGSKIFGELSAEIRRSQWIMFRSSPKGVRVPLGTHTLWKN